MFKYIIRFHKLVKFIRQRRKAGQSKFIILATNSELIIYSDQDDSKLIRLHY